MFQTCHSQLYCLSYNTIPTDFHLLLAASYNTISIPPDQRAMATPTADVTAIASLLKRERFYRDTGQWDLCRATFHPDAAATYINVAWLVSFLTRQRTFLDSQADRALGFVLQVRRQCGRLPAPVGPDAQGQGQRHPLLL